MSITTNTQENLTYQLPPNSILQLADYQRTPQVSIDTHKEFLLLIYSPTYKLLEDLNVQEISMG